MLKQNKVLQEIPYPDEYKRQIITMWATYRLITETVSLS